MKQIILHVKRSSDRSDQFFEFGFEIRSDRNVAVLQFDMVSFYKFNLGERYDAVIEARWKKVPILSTFNHINLKKLPGFYLLRNIAKKYSE
jgi:hypothetical protein